MTTRCRSRVPWALAAKLAREEKDSPEMKKGTVGFEY